jgi:hypothetical protein
MDELTNLLGGSATDVALNGGIVASVNGASEWITDQLEHFGLNEKLHRFYPFIPFAVAFILSLAIDQNISKAMSNCITYGTGAIALHSIHKVSVKGE